MTVQNAAETKQPLSNGERSKSSPREPDAIAASSPTNLEANQRWSTLWLTDKDIVVFTALALVLLILLAARWVRLSGFGREEVEIERLTPLEYSYRIDINTATWVEFAQLRDVGETLALRIVADREANGPFRSLEDLDRVKGIGPRTLEKLRPFLRFDPSIRQNHDRSRQRSRAFRDY